jgi:Fic family protein
LTRNYEQWVNFFLQAIYESAEDAVLTIHQLSKLHGENSTKLQAMPRNQNLLAVFSYVERNPIIEIKKTAAELGIAYNTAGKAVGTLVDEGVLIQNEKSGRTRTFSYEQYLEILRKDTF